MADYRAIAAISEGIMGLLRSSYPGSDMEFRVVTSSDLSEKPVANGASLFMYRVLANGSFRVSAGMVGHDGARRAPALPLDLHFLITLWGDEASKQHSLAGWIMRVLQDNPVLSASVLNSAIPGVFREDESVQIAPAELSNEDLFRIWAGLGNNAYQLSIPYIARVVNIEAEG